MNVTLVEGDLLDQRVDAIVNAWNRNIIPWWLLPAYTLPPYRWDHFLARPVPV